MDWGVLKNGNIVPILSTLTDENGIVVEVTVSQSDVPKPPEVEQKEL